MEPREGVDLLITEEGFAGLGCLRVQGLGVLLRCRVVG